MAGKCDLEIKVCKYSVTGESFCSSLKQELQKVYYELNLQSSEDCVAKPWVTFSKDFSQHKHYFHFLSFL